MIVIMAQASGHGRPAPCRECTASDRTMPVPGDHRRTFLIDERLAHADSDPFCGNYVLAGDRSFIVLRRLFDATSKMLLSFSPRIFFIEPELALFAAGLYTGQSIEPLLHERTSLFLGKDCLDDFAKFVAGGGLDSVPRLGEKAQARIRASLKRLGY